MQLEVTGGQTCLAINAGDNIVWGTGAQSDNIIWGTFAAADDNIVWSTDVPFDDNFVWDTVGAEDTDEY